MAATIQTHVNETSVALSGAREFVLDTAVVAVTQFLLKFRGLIVLPLIVKVLGTAQYGVWIQILALVDICGSLLGFNLYHALVRFLAAKPANGKSIYSTLMTATFGMSLFGAVLIYATAGQISHSILGGTDYLWHIRVGALLMVCYNIRLLNLNAYRAIGRLKQRSAFELLSTFGQLAGIGVLLWRGYTLLDVFIFVGLWELIYVLLLSSHIGRIVGWGKLQKPILISALRYALPLLPAGLSIWLLDRGDRLVIGYYLGPKVVGIYSANYAFAALLMLFQTPLQMTLFPKISSLWDTNRALAVRYVSASNKFFLTFAIPFIVVVPIIARGVLSRLGNDEIGAAGGVLTFLVAAGVMCWGVSVMQSQIFYGARRTVVVGVITVAAAVLNLLLNLLLVPAWGASGSAFSTLACYLLTCIAFYVMGRHIAKVEFFWPHLAKCLGASLLVGVVLRVVTTVWPDAMAATLIVGGIFYFALLWIMRAFAPAEIELIRGAFRLTAHVVD